MHIVCTISYIYLYLNTEQIHNMNKEVHINLTLDKRRELKNGKFPLRVRVFTPAPTIQKLYPTKFSFTESEYESVFNNKKQSPKHREILAQIIQIEEQLNKIANSISPFNFNTFEKLINRSNSDTTNIIYHFDQTVEKLNKNNQFGSANSYQLCLKSIKSFYELTNKKTDIIHFKEITPDFLQDYENHMTSAPKNRSITTVGIYLRALRAIFNIAISEKVIPDTINHLAEENTSFQTLKKLKNHLTTKS